MSKDGDLIIVRDGGYWRDRLRRYKVRVDGQQVGSLSEYESITIPVGSGIHDVQVRLDWGTSQTVTIDVQSGSRFRLRCYPRSSLGLIIPGMYLGLDAEGELASWEDESASGTFHRSPGSLEDGLEESRDWLGDQLPDSPVRKFFRRS